MFAPGGGGLCPIFAVLVYTVQLCNDSKVSEMLSWFGKTVELKTEEDQRKQSRRKMIWDRCSSQSSSQVFLNEI